MPLSATQRNLVAKFMATTSVSEKVAQRYLKNANYKLDVAADAYYSASNSASTSASQRTEAALHRMFDSLRGESLSSGKSGKGDIARVFADQPDPERDLDGDEIGAETMEAYTKSLGVNLEKHELFVLLEIVRAEAMGRISRKGFVAGWMDAGGASSATAQRTHVRAAVARAASSPDYFRCVYRAAFVAGKEADKRALDLDVALVFWDTLLGPDAFSWRADNIDWLVAWKRFLAERWAHRSVSRDMWNQTFEFAMCSREQPDLGFWSEDGAWPGVIDDFVVWCREQGVVSDGGVGDDGDGMELDG